MVPDGEDPVAQRGAAAGQPSLRLLLRRPLLQRRYETPPPVHPNPSARQSERDCGIFLFIFLFKNKQSLWLGLRTRILQNESNSLTVSCESGSSAKSHSVKSPSSRETVEML